MASLRFNRIPKIMCIVVVENEVKYLNQFSESDGISDNMSTLSMMTGKLFQDYKELTLEFGEYVQIFEDNDPKKHK